MTTDSELAYDLSGVLDVPELLSIPPGSSLLVSGPAMTGKEELVNEVLADGLRKGQGAVAVTTGGAAEDVVTDLQSRSPEAGGHQLATIDCRADGDREQTEVGEGASVTRVGAPSDLTGIGIGITQSFERLHDAGLSEGRVALTSLSTLLTFTDEKTVFKFSHVLTSRIDAADFVGVFTVDSSAHDEQTLQIVKQAFDALVEVRDEGRREARVRGFDGTSEWTPF